MQTHDIAVRRLRVLRGPNLHAYMPVLESIMDIGPYEERASDTFPGFVDRLTQLLSPNSCLGSTATSAASNARVGSLNGYGGERISRTSASMSPWSYKPSWDLT